MYLQVQKNPIIIYPIKSIFTAAINQLCSKEKVCDMNATNATVLPVVILMVDEKYHADDQVNYDEPLELSQMVHRRSGMAFLDCASSLIGALDESTMQYTNGRRTSSSKQQSKSLKDLFDDLGVDFCTIRYRKRSLERRGALSALHHPPFDPLGGGSATEPPATTASPSPEICHALDKKDNDHSFATKEEVTIIEYSDPLSCEGDSARMTYTLSNGVVGREETNFGPPKRVLNTSADDGSTVGTNSMPSNTLRLLKRASFPDVGNSRRNLESSLCRASSERILQNNRRNKCLSLELMSQHLRRTTSFFGFFAKQEIDDENRREGGEEVNVLLESMNRNDSRNLSNLNGPFYRQQNLEL